MTSGSFLRTYRAPIGCLAMLLGYGRPLIAQTAQSFSEAQSVRGAALYQVQCAGCHGAELGGGSRVPALRGDGFWRQWNTLAARKLYSRIITSMPANDPGSLTEPQVIELVSFLLHANGLPYGGREIERAKELNDIVLQQPASPQS